MSSPPTIPEVLLAQMLTDAELFQELVAVCQVLGRRDGDRYFAALASEAGRRWFYERQLAQEPA